MSVEGVDINKRDSYVSAASGIVLGLIFAFFVLSACSSAPNAKADAQVAEVDAILDLVHTSHQKWQTAQGQATTIWTRPDGTQQVYVQEFVVVQPASARFVSIQSEVEPVYDVWMSDGEYIYEVDTASKEYVRSPLPAFAFDLSFLEAVENDPDPVSVTHPFSMLIPSPVPQYLYPHWYAQQSAVDGTYRILGEEEWLERKTWKVEYEAEVASLAWIDQATGVILRFQQPGYVDFRMTSIAFDEPIDADVFTLPADFREE